MIYTSVIEIAAATKNTLSVHGSSALYFQVVRVIVACDHGFRSIGPGRGQLFRHKIIAL